MGGASDEYSYETEAHTFYVGAFTQLMKKLNLSTGFSYTLGKASSESLSFNTNPFVLTVGGRTDDYDFANVNNIDELSDLKYTAWEASISANYNITDSLGLNVNYKYQDYKDDQEYVYGDTSGESQSVSMFLIYRF